MDLTQLKVELDRYKQLFTQGQYSKCMKNLNETKTHKFSGLSLVWEHNKAVCSHLARVTRAAGGGASGSGSGTVRTSSQPQEVGGDLMNQNRTDRGVVQNQVPNITPMDNDISAIHSRTMSSLNSILIKLQGFPLQGAVLELECATVYNSCYLHLQHWINHQRHNGASAVSGSVLNCLKRVSMCVDVQPESSDAQNEHHVILDYIQRICDLRKSEDTISKVGPVILVYILYKLITHGADHRLLEILETFRLRIKHLKPLQYLFTFPLSKSPDTQYGAYLADASHIMLAVALYKLGQYDRCVEVLKANKCETFALTAVYIQGCAFYQLDKSEECIHCLDEVINSKDSPALAGQAVVVAGCCLSKQGSLQNAVQYFQRALQLNVCDPCALHHIADQYRRLGHHEAEKEALELLNNVLETRIPLSQSSSLTLELASLMIGQVDPVKSITQAEALYLSATRSCNLNRSEDASEKYLDLISLLMTDGVNATQSVRSGPVVLPRPARIFHEAAKALLACGRHDDVVTLCDQLLDSHDPLRHNSATQSQSQDSQQPGTSYSTQDQGPPGGRKRGRSASDYLDQGGALAEEEEEWWSTFPEDVVALKYKAEALYKMGDQDTALTCLTRLTYLLENHTPPTTSDQSAAPATKRPRLASDADFKSDDRLVAFTVDVYISKAILQERIGKLNCALYSTQSAVNLKPDNMQAVFTHCLLLLRRDQKDDALRLWTRIRDIEIRHMDSIHLDRLLTKKRNQISNRSSGLPKISTSEPSEEEKILLDIACLQHAQQSSLKRRMTFSK